MKRARSRRLCFHSRDPLQPSGDWLVFGTTLSSIGVDPYAGGRFRVDVGRGPRPDCDVPTRSLVELLEVSDLERYATLSRDIVSSFPRPPDAHVAGFPSVARESYLERFRPLPLGLRATFYQWAVFRTVEDVQQWGRFLMSVLPGAMAIVQAHSRVESYQLVFDAEGPERLRRSPP